MSEPTDPTAAAILELQAQNKALQTIVSLLLVESPQATAHVEGLLPHLDDMARQFKMSDQQKATLEETLTRSLALVRMQRGSGPATA